MPALAPALTWPQAGERSPQPSRRCYAFVRRATVRRHARRHTPLGCIGFDRSSKAKPGANRARGIGRPRLRADDRDRRPRPECPAIRPQSAVDHRPGGGCHCPRGPAQGAAKPAPASIRNRPNGPNRPLGGRRGRWGWHASQISCRC